MAPNRRLVGWHALHEVSADNWNRAVAMSCFCWTKGREIESLFLALFGFPKQENIDLPQTMLARGPRLWHFCLSLEVHGACGRCTSNGQLLGTKKNRILQLELEAVWRPVPMPTDSYPLQAVTSSEFRQCDCFLWNLNFNQYCFGPTQKTNYTSTVLQCYAYSIAIVHAGVEKLSIQPSCEKQIVVFVCLHHLNFFN